jgi:hypothetical protein
MEETGVLVVTAYVDIADAGKAQWIARCIETGSPFVGLFGLGPDFRSARKALATTIWAAVSGGTAGIEAGAVKGVRIMALTRKTFTPDELAAETA